MSAAHSSVFAGCLGYSAAQRWQGCGRCPLASASMLLRHVRLQGAWHPGTAAVLHMRQLVARGLWASSSIPGQHPAPARVPDF